MFMRDYNSGLNENDLMQCFGKSKMPVTNEPSNYKQYNVMVFVEFLEFVGRISDFRFRGVADMTYKDKLEATLEELCPAFGLVRKEVLVEVDELSESDDDY